MAAHQIAFRSGWIFKTESVIIPAVLDSISGAGWVRGLLPLLNRVGHSIPPLILAGRLEQAARKKWTLMITSWLMVGCFLLWSLLFTPLAAVLASWKAILFLVIYALFFCCVGVNQLALNTLQGKLIPTKSRGRLLYVSSVVGAFTAVTCALCILPSCLSPVEPRFDWLFLFPAAMFGIAAALVFGIREYADPSSDRPRTRQNVFVTAVQTLQNDRNFCKLAFVGFAASSSILLFPHYQHLGLQQMRLELKQLMWWVVIQNVGTAMFSIPMGFVADRGGNRLVLQIFMITMAAAPISALAITMFASSSWFVFVFLLIGSTPVVIRTLQNFTLEVCTSKDHAHYLSTLNVCLALPMVFSPFAGWCVDLFGFTSVFIGVTVVILAGWCVTFSLNEPRSENRSLGNHAQLMCEDDHIP